MPLTLQYVGQTSLPVEVEGFTPDWAADKSLAEIERFEIFHGKQAVPLAEFFRISGDARDQQLHFEGDLSGVHWIGAHMRSGCIRIQSSVGRHLGSHLQGGEIHVQGNAGDWLGGEMRRGFIHVHGNAGHFAGAAYRGAPKGMTGGTLLISGNVGHEIGLRMRRGLIAVGGAAGDLIGFNLIAGTILVFGNGGQRPGAGMRRGTIGLFGPRVPQLLPSFRYANTYASPVLPLLLRELQSHQFAVAPELFQAEFDYYQGDFVTTGRGEILLPRAGCK